MLKQDLSWISALDKKKHRSRERYRNACRAFRKRFRQALRRITNEAKTE